MRCGISLGSTSRYTDRICRRRSAENAECTERSNAVNSPLIEAVRRPTGEFDARARLRRRSGFVGISGRDDLKTEFSLGE
jgi:hypothetical protein